MHFIWCFKIAHITRIAMFWFNMFCEVTFLIWCIFTLLTFELVIYFISRIYVVIINIVVIIFYSLCFIIIRIDFFIILNFLFKIFVMQKFTKIIKFTRPCCKLFARFRMSFIAVFVRTIKNTANKLSIFGVLIHFWKFKKGIYRPLPGVRMPA